MKEMKTLTIDDETYDIFDDGATHFDREQPLTPEQKAQARENIGAAAAGESSVIIVTDDSNGNVTISTSDGVSITDDGNGNISIG